MKNRLRALLVVAAALAAPGWGHAAPPCPALLQQTFPRLQDERPVNLCDYAGRVILVVNTASQCGYTPQYRSLEAIYQRYRERGFVVLGFPSNDFGGQEPGSNSEIAAFCENQFAVRFPMFAKSTVREGGGAAVNPLFAALARQTGQAPRWNFHKYLIARDGTAVVSHGSSRSPEDRALIRDLERLIDSK
jgi:glutathione peroxidase